MEVSHAETLGAEDPGLAFASPTLASWPPGSSHLAREVRQVASLRILPGRSPRRAGGLRWGWGGKGALGKNQPPLSSGVHGRAPGVLVCVPSSLRLIPRHFARVQRLTHSLIHGMCVGA